MKKVLSIALALLLVLGNLGITFGKHYCMGIPVKEAWMLGHEDMSCGMTSMEASRDQDVTSFSKDCCDDEFYTLEGADVFKQQKVGDDHSTTFFQSKLLYEIAVLCPTSQQLSSPFYYPPPPDVDMTIVHQVFRI